MRPARDSESCGSMTFAEPVSKNRPGCRLRSMAALIDGESLGTCCTSSSVTGVCRPATKPLGSRLAAGRMPGSSKAMIINHNVDDYHSVGSDHRIRSNVRRPLYGLTVPN